MKLTAESTVFNDEKVQSKFSELIVDADGIRTEVSKKVGNDEVISRINQSAESVQIQASKVAIEADNFVTQFGTDGVKLHPKNDDLNYTTIDPTNGMNVYKGGVSVAEYGDNARIGKEDSRYVKVSSDGMQLFSSTSEVAKFGYGTVNNPSGTTTAPYFTLGDRLSGSANGNRSVAIGNDVVASGAYSIAGGARSLETADGVTTVYNTTASGNVSFAYGTGCEASAHNASAFGGGTIARGENQFVVGKYNVADTTSLFIIGKGISNSARANAFSVNSSGTVYVNGTSVHSSDRRLKEHLSYLGDEAIEFVDGLKPAHYIKDGEKHVGFYAQDVQEVDKWDCMIGEEMNGYMTLSYMDLIAPLVTYCQKLEKRIEELEREVR